MSGNSSGSLPNIRAQLKAPITRPSRHKPGFPIHNAQPHDRRVCRISCLRRESFGRARVSAHHSWPPLGRRAAARKGTTGARSSSAASRLRWTRRTAGRPGMARRRVAERPSRGGLRGQISRDNGFRKTQRFLRFFHPFWHLFAASLEPDIPVPENTKTRSQGPGFEYRLPFGGLFKKRSKVVGRGRVELPQLSRRFYRPLGSPNAQCRPTNA